MKFKEKDGRYYILIDKEWYFLCACINEGCKDRVHAFSSRHTTVQVEQKIRCCRNPNNNLFWGGADRILEEFVEEWSD